MWNDDIVSEVRAIREAHAAKYKYDLRAIVEDLKKSEEKHKAEGFIYVEPPPKENLPTTPLQRMRFAHR
jgi:hypothetical protein